MKRPIVLSGKGMHLCHSFIKLLAALIDVCKVAWNTIDAVNITLGQKRLNKMSHIGGVFLVCIVREVII